jgi:hypothetical protein
VLLTTSTGPRTLLAQAIFQLRERRIGNALAAIVAGSEGHAGGADPAPSGPPWWGEESRVLDQAIGLMMYDPVRYAELGRGHPSSTCRRSCRSARRNGLAGASSRSPR